MLEKFKTFLQTSSQNNVGSAAILLLRLVVGLAFVTHGSAKIVHPFAWMPPEAPIPAVLQFLAAFSEFFGGLALIIGLLTPLAASGIGFTMLVAVSFHVFMFKQPFVNVTGGPSYELPLLYLIVSLLIMALGAGKFSLDAKLFGERD